MNLFYKKEVGEAGKKKKEPKKEKKEEEKEEEDKKKKQPEEEAVYEYFAWTRSHIIPSKLCLYTKLTHYLFHSSGK